MKHTPGPWEIRYLSGLDMEIVSEQGRICSFSGFSHSVELMDWHEENERANAQLISTAPELLEALENCVKVMENLENTGNVGFTHSNVYKDAKEAIKKATL